MRKRGSNRKKGLQNQVEFGITCENAAACVKWEKLAVECSLNLSSRTSVLLCFDCTKMPLGIIYSGANLLRIL